MPELPEGSRAEAPILGQSDTPPSCHARAPSPVPGRMNAEITFETHRSRLFGLSYRLLGSRSDAEDVVQDTWLRWQQADRTGIRDPEAWLVTAATRLGIDRLRAARPA